MRLLVVLHGAIKSTLADIVAHVSHQATEEVVLAAKEIAVLSNAKCHAHSLLQTITHRIAAEIHTDEIWVNQSSIALSHGRLGNIAIATKLHLLPLVGGSKVADAAGAGLTSRVSSCNLAQKLKRRIGWAVARLWTLSVRNITRYSLYLR